MRLAGTCSLEQGGRHFCLESVRSTRDCGVFSGAAGWGYSGGNTRPGELR